MRGRIVGLLTFVILAGCGGSSPSVDAGGPSTVDSGADASADAGADASDAGAEASADAAIEAGVNTNALARMTEDAARGIEKFAKKK